MKPQHTITFLAELLELTSQIHELVKEHCQLIVDNEQDGHLVEFDDEEEIPF